MKKNLMITVCMTTYLSLYAQNETVNGTLDVTGNVGIGVSNPTERLEVKSSSSEFKTYQYGSEVTVSTSNGWARGFRVRNETKNENVAFGALDGKAFISTGFDIDPGADPIGYKSANFFITPVGKVGIGTKNPHTELTIYTDETKFITLEREGVPKKGHIGYGLEGGGGIYLGTDDTHYSLYIQQNGNVGVGTYFPDERLSVNGKIKTKEVIVSLSGWSDFVFENTYDLPSLEEVEEHINTKGHLKDIPSEAEVLEDGIEVGEMNSKLLQKIEELTLYTIEQEKQINAQKEELKALEKMVDKQNADVKKLTALVNQLMN